MSTPHSPWDVQNTVTYLLCDRGVEVETRRLCIEYNQGSGRVRLALYAKRDGLWHRVETMGEADGYAIKEREP
jgi:hypothetical protein